MGAIIAGPFSAAIMRRLGEAMLANLGMASAAAGYALLIPHQIATALLGSALLGFSIAWIIVGIITLLQRNTPAELMGRTSAAFSFAYSVPQTLAIALGASLVAIVNYQVLLLIVASIMLVGCGYLLTRPEQRLHVAVKNDLPVSTCFSRRRLTCRPARPTRPGTCAEPGLDAGPAESTVLSRRAPAR